MTTIAVSGKATHHHPAERGTLNLTLGFDAAKREDAFNATVALHNVVAAEARKHQESQAATWWSANRVGVWAYQEYVKDSDVTVTKHRARSGITVKFQDFDALASWVSAVAEREGVQVDGITWALTEKTRTAAEKRARTDAVQDALTKAAAYAEALGLGQPEVQAIFEPGLRPNVPVSGGFEAGGSMMRAAAVTTSSSSTLEVKPEDLVVEAVITADFVATA